MKHDNDCMQHSAETVRYIVKICKLWLEKQKSLQRFDKKQQDIPALSSRESVYKVPQWPHFVGYVGAVM